MTANAPSSDDGALSWTELAGLLSTRAAERPDGLGVADGAGHDMSWGALHAVSEAIRTRLAGVDPSASRVGLWAPNSVLWAPALFGIWASGATAVIVSGLARPEEARRLLDTAATRTLVCPSDWLASAGERTAVALDEEGTPAGSSTMAAPPLARPGAIEALVLFTSGTTGEPRGIVHGGEALQASLAAMASSAGLVRGPRPLAERDRKPNLVMTPLSHTSGLMALLFSWWAGKPLVVLTRFTAAGLVGAVRDHGITTLRLIPTMVHDLVEASEHIELSGVEYATVGTAALPETTRLRFEARFGIPLLATYGQTETIGGVAAERLADVRAGLRPPGTVGRPLPGVEIRIADAVTGVAVPDGDTGEIRVRTAQVMRRYLGRADADAPVDTNGFLRTGDLGHLSNGFLSVTGRLKDIVVAGGFNVYPAEVEEALRSCPGVLDVIVVGARDARLGEVPVAVVIGEDIDAAVLDGSLREKLAPYKRPRAYVFVDVLPRTDLGKPDRRAVAGLLADGTLVAVPAPRADSSR